MYVWDVITYIFMYVYIGTDGLGATQESTCMSVQDVGRPVALAKLAGAKALLSLEEKA